MWYFEKNGEVQVARIVELLYAGSSCYLERKYNAAINIHLAWKRPTAWASVCGAGVQAVEAPGF